MRLTKEVSRARLILDWRGAASEENYGNVWAKEIERGDASGRTTVEIIPLTDFGVIERLQGVPIFPPQVREQKRNRGDGSPRAT